ncbi:MAG: TonB-dependent receptor [Melioribacteraceae bacterium]|jgi:vitamin B12 transporter|nr:TonB-dependent receptor [Melioribacteraceae bacterium]
MKILLYIIITILLNVALAAQNKVVIKGVVDDSKNKPLPYVNVFILNSFEGAMTDEEGRFDFVAKSKNEFTIVASTVGYKKHQKSLKNNSNEILELEIILAPTSIELEEAVVTSSGFSSQEEEGITVTQMDVFTTPGGAADIYQSLKTMPGLTQVSESAELFVRGGNPNETITMIDQAPIYHPFTLESSYGGLFSNLNTSSFKDLYFSSGGFSVKYGNVLSGVLDIETKNEPTSFTFDIGISMASAQVSTSVPIVDEKLGLHFYSQQSFTKPLMMANGIGDRFSNYPTSRNIGLSLIYRYSKSGRIKIFGMLADDNQGVEVEEANFTGIFNGLSNNRFINIQHSDIIGNNLFTKNSFSYNRFSNIWKLGVLNLESADVVYKYRNDNELLLNTKTKLLFGVEIENRKREYIGTIPAEDFDMRDREGSGEIINETVGGTRFGIYLEVIKSSLWGIRNLSGIIGVRFDYAKQINLGWADPRFSIGYKLGDEASIKGGIGMFHQLPDIRLLAPMDGNPDLLPMSAVHYSLSYDQKIDKKNNFRIEAYYKDYDQFPLEHNFKHYVSQGYGYAAGIDAILKGKLSSELDGWISYGFIKTERKWMDFKTLTNSSFDITHNLSIVARYNITSMWQLGTTYKLATGRPYTPIVGSDYRDDLKIYEPEYGSKNSDRYKFYQRLDFRITHLNQLFGKYFTVFYIEALNILNIHNMFGYAYNQDYSKRKEVDSYFGQRILVLGMSISL